jgi:hypothetical protein
LRADDENTNRVTKSTCHYHNIFQNRARRSLATRAFERDSGEESAIGL